MPWPFDNLKLMYGAGTYGTLMQVGVLGCPLPHSCTLNRSAFC